MVFTLSFRVICHCGDGGRYYNHVALPKKDPTDLLGEFRRRFFKRDYCAGLG